MQRIILKKQLKVLLVDVDSKIPNIALMKLKTKYPQAVFLKIGFNAYPHKKHKVIDNTKYDLTFVSVIFAQNKNRIIFKKQPTLVGGTGHNLIIKLPQDIDQLIEDYSIYPDSKFSYIFITRGCPNKCYFCIVPKKEGNIQKYYDWEKRIQHKQINFLDNNFLAFEDSLNILDIMIQKKYKVKFNAGLDIRYLTEEKAKKLSQLKYIGEYIFAFDNINLFPIIKEKIPILKKYISKNWKIKMCVYINKKDTIENIKQRIFYLKQNNILPYIMRDSNCYKSINSSFYSCLAAWCNQPHIFKTKTFEQVVYLRIKNKKTRKKILKFWYFKK